MDPFALRSLLKGLVLPPTGPLIVAILGLLIARNVRFRRLGWGMLIAAIAILWLLSMPLISGQLVRAVEDYPPFHSRNASNAQALVILGGGTRIYAPEYGAPAPRHLTLQRLAYGVRVSRVARLPVLVTGGNSEGVTMADVLRRDFQLSPLWIEQRARDTHENAKFSAALLKASNVSRVVLVTSALHMRRSVAEFEAQGIAVVPAPVDVSNDYVFAWMDLVPGMGALEKSHYALYEMMGDVVRRVRRKD